MCQDQGLGPGVHNVDAFFTGIFRHNADDISVSTGDVRLSVLFSGIISSFSGINNIIMRIVGIIAGKIGHNGNNAPKYRE